MIDVKEAVRIASDHFTAFFEGKRVGEQLLEEVELSEDKKLWQITIGYDWQPGSGTASLGPGQRMFKVLHVDVETGAVLAMRKTTF
ncbi:hypothetical protein SCOR_10405 [Sulfidibacter corallicola]|uniref:NTF2 fold immunity protein n=1 Tax=Sulfidibacter corallicola TaxID=2818388 RepID=A0A8A4THG7_SULCO|nr:hypothetical protein [Sulfidibacter corallicola]QTD48251.1 hypothetical protein J3U87_21925 [Sulfidibacter corallicola]